MLPKKLFNPTFGEEFEIGKDVEYITTINYTPKYREPLEVFFKYVVNNKVITDDIYDEIKRIYGLVKEYFYKDYSLKDFFSDFINILNLYSKNLEKDRSLYDNVVNYLKENDKAISMLVSTLKDKGVDLYPVYVKTLKGLINDLKSRGEQLLQKMYEPETIEKFKEFEKSINSYDSSIELVIIDKYIEFLKASKLNNIINFLNKQIFSAMYEFGLEDWWANPENWFTNMITNSFMNKLSKSGINVVKDDLQVLSIGLLSDIIDKGVLAYKYLGSEFYFKDDEIFEKFNNMKTFETHSDKILTKLITNPDALRYIHPNFLKEFSDFDDFINNSGIKKDGDYFSLFYYFGMLYGYDNSLIPEREFIDRFDFKERLLNGMPIQKNHIRNYINSFTLNIYNLKPKSVNYENSTYKYDTELLIKYFGISNKDSCVRNRLIKNKDIKSYDIYYDTSFMIIADSNGNTVGRFIEVGDKIFINLYYNNMAYETAFLNGGKTIIREYINNQKSIDYEFELDYKEKDIGYESEWVKDVVKSRMG
ncbi:MAG: hypothetical protein QXX12_05480, partial [Nanopusillaceae archaeon]